MRRVEISPTANTAAEDLVEEKDGLSDREVAGLRRVKSRHLIAHLVSFGSLPLMFVGFIYCHYDVIRIAVFCLWAIASTILGARAKLTGCLRCGMPWLGYSKCVECGIRLASTKTRSETRSLGRNSKGEGNR